MSKVYVVEYRSTDPRPNGGNNTIHFGAADDTVAGDIVNVLDDAIAGQRTQLSCREYYDPGATLPDGTRRTATVLGVSTDDAVYKWRLRNVKLDVTDEMLVALFAGTSVTGGAHDVAALSAAPHMPGSGDTPAGAINVAFNLKP